jgi:cell division protein FtsB
MRLSIVMLALVFALLQVKLWLSEDGLREVWRLEAEVTRRSADNARLVLRNNALEAEVLDLKQGLTAAEERARSELGMVQPDETFYQIAPAPAQAQ